MGKDLTLEVTINKKCCEESFVAELFGKFFLTWRSQLRFTSKKFGHMIALPGRNINITCQHVGESLIRQGIVKVYWVSDNYKAFKKYRSIESGSGSHKCSTPSCCLNYSSISQGYES